MEAIKIKEMIEPIRKKMSRYGTEKLHLDIAEKLRQSNIKMGRDQVFKILPQPSFTGYPKPADALSPLILTTIITGLPILLKTLYLRMQSRYS